MASGKKIFKTADGGAQWDTLTFERPINKIVINPINPDIIYVASTIGILKSKDAGQTWQFFNEGIDFGVIQTMTAFVIDPIQPDTSYAGTGGPFGGSLFKSTDGGESWFEIGCPDSVTQPNPPDCAALTDGVISLAVTPTRPATLYAGTAFTAWLLKSTDGGESWQGPNPTTPGFVKVITVHPTNPQIVFASSGFGGLFRTADGGENWKRENLPDTTKGIQAITFKPLLFKIVL